MDHERNGWVSFGTKPAQVLHPDTAAELLAMFCERHRALFGALLAEALTGEPPKLSRGRRASPAEAPTGGPPRLAQGRP